MNWHLCLDSCPLFFCCPRMLGVEVLFPTSANWCGVGKSNRYFKFQIAWPRRTQYWVCRKFLFTVFLLPETNWIKIWIWTWIFSFMSVLYTWPSHVFSTENLLACGWYFRSGTRRMLQMRCQMERSWLPPTRQTSQKPLCICISVLEVKPLQGFDGSSCYRAASY